jgi:hypothetical protein
MIEQLMLPSTIPHDPVASESCGMFQNWWKSIEGHPQDLLTTAVAK